MGARAGWRVDGTLWGGTIYLAGVPYALGLDPDLGRLYVSFAPELDDPRQVLVYRIPARTILARRRARGHGGPDGGGGIGANPLPITSLPPTQQTTA